MAYPVLSIANKILAYGVAANDEGELFFQYETPKIAILRARISYSSF